MMFDLLCSLVERDYSKTKLMVQLARAVPIALPPPIEGSVYVEAGGAEEVWEHFRLQSNVVSIETEEQCFVVADEQSGQQGLGPRVVIHAQLLEGLPDELAEEVALPSHAVMVSVSKLWANSVEDHVPMFEGEVGFGFVASRKRGVIVTPGQVRLMTMLRSQDVTDDIEEQRKFEHFGQVQALRSAVGALECLIGHSRQEFVIRPPELRTARRRKRLLREKEREWLVVK